jgi:3-hydroxybutyryl-CoA dehydratase
MAKQFNVGDTFRHVRECDKYRPIYYAGASGDFNPIHIDQDVGEMAGLGGVILQGLCTMAWAVEGAVNFIGDPGRISRVKVRFSKPVAIDDTITYEGKVVKLEGGKLVAEITARNQKGDEVLKGAVVEARVD